ncbi:hypothetical protein [uncultured Aquincola sp.]|uniref:hypothetical protein n=1 Tax=uncultured Aquincola sp. TaxID=886556 RepID=UPI0032B1A294
MKSLFVRPFVMLLASAAGLAAMAAPEAPLPRQLVCTPDAQHRYRLSHDAAGQPLQLSVALHAGTRECDFSSAGTARPQPDGSWRFDWQDETLGQRQRVDVRRSGEGGYALAFTPAACGALQLPATVTLAPGGAGCSSSVDRDVAFDLFWQQLRGAVARGDGAALQQLSLPQLEFVEGPDTVKAPASVMRQAARCLPGVPATTRQMTLRDLLAPEPPPRLDQPPVSRRGNTRIDLAGAMSLTWTAQGWRIDGFNTSPDVFRQCKG